MIVSSLGLLVYTEVIKYQMRKQAAGDNSNSFKGVVKKTGIFTFFGFTMTLVNLILNTLFPDKSKNQNYFLSQDLFSCFVIGVILPLIIAKTNDAMSKLFELRLTFNDAEENGRWCLNNFISKIFSRNKNMIHPIV
jgi:hypothetical protein